MKPNFTLQQKKAIYVKDNNILVSAGAGSGKTAILTERVLQKLIDGLDITQLVIITFTKAAAGEMLERIRNKIEEEIKNYPYLEKQLELLDSAYITTFDAFSMSLVKKYHYVLNLNPSINIGDKIIFQNELKKIIDLMFEEYIKNENKNFIDLLNDFTITDSNMLKENIIKIFYQYQSFVSPIKDIEEIFNEQYLEEQKQIYLENIKNIKNDIKEILKELHYVDTDENGQEYIKMLSDYLLPIISNNSFEETYFSLDEPMLQKSRKKFEGKNFINEYYDEIKILINQLNNLIDVESMQIYQERYLSTKNNANTILSFIKELEIRFYEFKKSINSFDYADVVKMCLNIVQNNPEIQMEIRESINEIMIDEYQDTDDFQNKLVELISNNNVYMVGDIKQSIYGFRNANPKNFSNKYIDFKNNIDGIAIDLNKNFRSNQLVLENINNIFAPIMSKDIGGVDYDESQSLVFGNTNYSISSNKEQFNIFRYNLEYIKELKENKVFITKHEYEAIIIANDIKNKIDSNFQVVDLKNKKMRDCMLSDFSILTRNKKHIKTYNKILRSYGLIVDAQEDVEYKVERDIILIKNLLIAINFDNVNDYKNALISILRSFLFDFDDKIIDDIFRDFTFEKLNNSIFKDIIVQIRNLFYKKDILSNEQLIIEILNEFEILKHITKLEDVHAAKLRLLYIIDIAKQIDSLHFDLEDFIAYFENLDRLDTDIDIVIPKVKTNAVSIMTYHRSKGLEFPVVYLPNLDKKFNTSDLNDRILANKLYGIILNESYEKDNENGLFMRSTFIKENLKNNVKQDLISEEIRMLYVATTRAKEQLILIMSDKEHNYKNMNKVSERTKLTYQSYFDMIVSSIDSNSKTIIDFENISIDILNNYLEDKKINSNKPIDVVEQKIIFKTIETQKQQLINKRASMSSDKLINKNIMEQIKIGNDYHIIMESLDFNNLDGHLGMYDEQVDNIINNIKMHDLFKNYINIYKEYEYIYEVDNKQTHGIIDLLIEKEDKFIIVDYKLSDIHKDEYVEQINSYIDFMKTKTEKKVEGYLYSLLKNEFKKIENKIIK